MNSETKLYNKGKDMVKQKFLFLGVLLLLILRLSAYAASSDCWVADPDIRGTYEGGCKNGKANGMGLAIGRDSYKGGFKDGKKSGKGRYTWSNGDMYDGQWKDDKKSGKGRITFGDYNKNCGEESLCFKTFRGTFVNGLKSFGILTYYNRDGRDKVKFDKNENVIQSTPILPNDCSSYYSIYDDKGPVSAISQDNKVRVKVKLSYSYGDYPVSIKIYDNKTGEKIGSKHKEDIGTPYPIFCISRDGSGIVFKDNSIGSSNSALWNIYISSFTKEFIDKFNSDFKESFNDLYKIRHFIKMYKDEMLLSKQKNMFLQAKKQEKKLTNILYNTQYKNSKSKNTISAYTNFVKKYPKAPQVKDALQNCYSLVKSQNNIAGYEWFIKTYPDAPQVKDAISKIHQLAFDEAKDIGTISAYNTFIISYPMAKEVKEANALAKELERYKYTDTLPSWVRKVMPNFLVDILNKIFGIFSNDEKKSRALLIKAKQIERQGNEYNGVERAGYIIIANRMYDLLQEEYNDTDATLRFLESEEFKDFIRTFKTAMRSINDKLDHISRYSSEILQVSKQGLTEANADRAMSEYKTEEYRKWQKFMHFRDKGYQ